MGKKENLNLNAINTIYPITGLFKIMKYDDKWLISIVNLVETTWLARYPCPTEITYDQGLESTGREFIKPLIEERYGILANPITLGNPNSNAVLERIHAVLGNLVREE